MAEIGVIGLGNWGTAIATVWLGAGHKVSAWTIEEDVHESIRTKGVNEKYLGNVRLDGLEVSLHLEEVARRAELIVLAVPSSVVLDVFDQLLPHLRDDQVLLDLAKGLAPGQRLVSEALVDRLKEQGLRNPLAVVSGPTIAPEVARGIPTTALVASHDRALAEELARTLSTPTFHLQPADDPRGAELWGAFKNVIALACGVVDGLGPDHRGDNLKAAIFGAGFREGCQLLPALGAAPETALTPAGIGDLYVTATSAHSRNRQMGQKLGQGLSLEEALGEMIMVSEGVRAARMFREHAAEIEMTLPFLDSVASLLDGSIEPRHFVRRMLSG